MNSFGHPPYKAIRNLARQLIKDQADLCLLAPEDGFSIRQILILCLLIPLEKETKKQLEAISSHPSYFSSWEDCDTALILIKKPLDIDLFLPFHREFKNSASPFMRRMSFTFFLRCRLNTDEDKIILPLLADDEAVTVRMGQGWLLSEMIIRDSASLLLFPEAHLPKRTLLIGLQKSLDSFRVEKKTKNDIRAYRQSFKLD